MSAEERTGRRNLAYSAWHRPSRTKYFLGLLDASRLYMVDVDSCEACEYCKEPVALIEHHRGTNPKRALVTQLLARLAGISAYSVAYTLVEEPSSCASCGQENSNPDIASFVVRQIEPPEDWKNPMDPEQYARFLLGLRRDHRCKIREAG